MKFYRPHSAADATGGLKGRARQRPSLQGLGGGSPPTSSAGIYRGIACHYSSHRNSTLVF